MDNQTIQQLKDAISKSKNIGIAVGQQPSVDQMAAALSLYLLLQQARRPVTIASPTDPIVELSSLVGINRVQRQLGGDAGDLVVSFPYKEGEIEKVSYTLENNFLNIIVKAAEQGLSFDERDIRYTRGSGSVDLLFVVGTASLNELEGVFDTQKAPNTRIINIDNSESNQKFGDMVLVSPRFSSVSEQIADLALALGFNIDKDVAQNLLSGITTATKNFQDPRTTSLAFEVAAYLMKKGANRAREAAGGTTNGQAQFGQPQQQPAPRQQFAQPQPQQTAAPRPQPQPQPQAQPQMQQQRQQPAQQSDSRQPLSDDRREELRRQLRAQEEQQQTNVQEATGQAQTQGQQQSDEENAPVDWLEPKVYKGSSNF